jgi:preprotein translocase subunit YajC
VATLLPLLIVVALFAVMVIVPGRRRSRDQQQMRSNLAPGVDVMTTAGLYGRVDAIDTAQGTVDLEVSDGVIVRFANQAIARVITTQPADEQAEDDLDEHEPETDETDEAEQSESGVQLAESTDEATPSSSEDDASSQRGKDGTA